MKIEFPEELMLGYEELDSQHVCIHKAFTEMLDAMSSGKSHTKFFSLIKFLEDYATEHFAMEEDLMESHNYPKIREHREEHWKFAARFSEQKERFEKEGVTSSLVIKTQNWLFEWLTDHIKRVDREFIEFVKPRIENGENLPAEKQVLRAKDAD